MAAKKRQQRQKRILAVLSGQFIDEARKLYGSVVDLYSNPELKPLFEQAFINQWSVDEFLNRFDQTQWAKDRTTAQEQFDILQASKPEEAKAKLDTVRSLVNTTVGGLGLTLTDAQLGSITMLAARNGWSGQQFTSGVGAEAIRLVNQSGAGQAPISTESVRQVAQEYGTPVSDGTVKQWADEIAAGTKTLEQWVQEQRRNAQNLYAPIADRLETQTFKQITDPYRQIAGATLETDPNAIDLSQSKWSRLFQSDQSKPNEPKMMNITEWTRFVRSQPEWQNTANAYREYADMANQLSQMFRGRP